MKRSKVVTILMALLLLCGSGTASAQPLSQPRAVAQVTGPDAQRISDLSNNLHQQYKLAQAITNTAVQKLKNSSDPQVQFNCMKAIGHTTKAAALLQQTVGMLGIQSLDAAAISAGIHTTAGQLYTQAKVDPNSTRKFLLEDSETTVTLVAEQLTLAQDFLKQTGP